MKKWEQLPSDMQTEEIRPYYEVLRRKRCSLFFKRVFDIFISALMLIALSPLFFVLAVAIKIDSRGPVFYRQERITRYGKKFRIFMRRSYSSHMPTKPQANPRASPAATSRIWCTPVSTRTTAMSRAMTIMHQPTAG